MWGGGGSTVGCPRDGVTVTQHSMPVRVSVVMVDETPGLSNPNLSSTPVGGFSQPISGAAPPADEPVMICYTLADPAVHVGGVRECKIKC